MARKASVRIAFGSLGATVPGPARYEDGIDAFAALQLADRHAWQFRVAGPFAFTGDDEVEIELPYQSHAMRARRIVDAGEGLIEQHEAGACGLLPWL